MNDRKNNKSLLPSEQLGTNSPLNMLHEKHGFCDDTQLDFGPFGIGIAGLFSFIRDINIYCGYNTFEKPERTNSFLRCEKCLYYFTGGLKDKRQEEEEIRLALSRRSISKICSYYHDEIDLRVVYFLNEEALNSTLSNDEILKLQNNDLSKEFPFTLGKFNDYMKDVENKFLSFESMIKEQFKPKSNYLMSRINEVFWFKLNSYKDKILDLSNQFPIFSNYKNIKQTTEDFNGSNQVIPIIIKNYFRQGNHDEAFGMALIHLFNIALNQNLKTMSNKANHQGSGDELIFTINDKTIGQQDTLDFFIEDHPKILLNGHRLNGEYFFEMPSEVTFDKASSCLSFKKEGNFVIEIKNNKYKRGLKFAIKIRKRIAIGLSKRYLSEGLSKTVLIGYQNKNELILNFRDNGNTMVHTTPNDINSSTLTTFVTSYIIRLLESSEIGSINVHIVDYRDEWLFKRLKSSFHKNSNLESSDKIINLYDNAEKAVEILKRKIEETSLKILNLSGSNEKTDFYSLFSHDKNDSINLFVITGGLIASLNDYNSKLIHFIDDYSKPNSKGHKAGMRFLIVDDSMGQDDRATVLNRQLLNRISKNFEYNFVLDNNSFYASKSKVEPLLMDGDIDAKIITIVDNFVDALSKKQNHVLDYGDIGFGLVTYADMGPTISIPIGLSGTEIINVPLSCADLDQSPEGANIGFMVIGASGSGKSTFMHSLIINGCMKYSPEDLQFWLLDFKSGSATNKYLNANLPHIHILAENNKIEDAFSIFNMLLEEMEKRICIFNRFNCSDVYAYNKYVKEHPNLKLAKIPRIIICIDETQELFVDENSQQLAQLIGRISTRMRSSGLHFVFISQNLSMNRTSYMDDAFLKHANGRVAFRLTQKETIRESHYPEEFVSRADDIVNLSTCVAYLSYGPGTIKKVNICRCHDTQFEFYFKQIREKYKQFKCKTLIIGSRQRLSVTDTFLNKKKYINEIEETSKDSRVVIGENTYTLSPIEISLSPETSSSLLFLGTNNLIMESLCISAGLVGIDNSTWKINAFNGHKELKFINSTKNTSLFDLFFNTNCSNIKAFNSSDFPGFIKKKC